MLCEEASQAKMKGWTFVPHKKGPDTAHRALLSAGSMARYYLCRLRAAFSSGF